MKYANISAVVTWSQGKAVLAKGKTTAADNHPLVLERPDLWTDALPEPTLSEQDGPIETATRAPGERRAGRPRLPRDEHGNIIRP